MERNYVLREEAARARLLDGERWLEALRDEIRGDAEAKPSEWAPSWPSFCWGVVTRLVAGFALGASL